MVDTIAKLATAAASDRAAIAQLTATVTRLTTELATMNVKLVVDLQKIAPAGAATEGAIKPPVNKDPEPEHDLD